MTRALHAACTLSAAIAYVEGWRVGGPREWGTRIPDDARLDELPLYIRHEIDELVTFFTEGGDLEYLLQRERFYDRQSLLAHQRRLQDPTLRWF